MKALLEQLKAMAKMVDGQENGSYASTSGKTNPRKIVLASTLSLLSVGTLFGSIPQRVEAATYTYDNTTSNTIDGTTICSAPITRTFNVTDNFTVQDVNLGFNADHVYRGDIQVTLRHPDGTAVQVISSNGGDSSAGYDVLLDSGSGNSLNDGDFDDTATPLYDRTAAPSNSLAAFNGKASNGTWTLEVCDTFVGSDDGTFNSAQLILDDTAPPIDPSLPTGPRPFSLRYSVDTKGNMAAIGNASLICDTANASCTNGLATGSVGNNNGGLAMQMLDTDSDDSTFNSSSADLTVPAGASVLFAGLYWGGTSDGATTAAPDASKRNEALLATPGSGYQTVTADTYTSIDNSATTGWDVYSSFTDVTSLVQSAGSGTYTMANVQASTGTGFTYPNAGWSLIVVYEDATEPMRNMTVFDGYNFSGFDTGNTQTLTGLRTPPTAGFDVFMGAFAGDGEPDTTGDTLSVNNVPVSDAVNPSNNFYNGTISRYGSHTTDRNPSNPYNMVVDIDHLDLTVWNQTNNAIPTNATSIDLNLSTSGDGIWPMVYFFGVEVFEPNLVTQFEKTTPSTTYATGDTIPYTISVTNTGNDNSINTVITDAIPTGTTYVPGSLKINGVTKTDGSGDDEAEFDGSNVVFRVGTGANASQGGQVNINDSVTMTFDVTVTATEGELVCNQASIDYTGATSGNAGSGVSDDPNTPAVDDCTEITTTAASSNMISGTVFEDFGASGTGNNTPDTGENGLGDITLTLYKDDGDGLFDAASDTQIITTASNSTDGTYSFGVSSDGKYFVVLDHLDSDAPSASTALPDRTVREVDVAGADVTDEDFPYDQLGSTFQSGGLCNPNAFLFQKDPSEAYELNLVTGESLPSGSGYNLTEPATGTDPLINGIGYSAVDDYIYGYARHLDDGSIVRVNTNYEATLLGPIPGVTGGISVGDVSADGKLYVRATTSTTTSVIDVNPNSSTYLQLLNNFSTTVSDIHDWAFNPIDNQLYTIVKGTRHLHRVNPTTGVSEDLGDTGISGTKGFGAVYMDASGFFYASDNTTGDIYRIDLTNPGALSAANPIDANTMVTFLADGPSSSSNDGARCMFAPLPIDFGDAPDTGSGNGTGNYNTLLNDDGPRHAVDGTTYLGSGVSIDTDAFGDGTDSNSDATDDTNDDGVQLSSTSLQGQSLTVDDTLTLDITTAGSGVLNAWIDWNGDGVFDDATESIADNADVSGGTLSVTIPATATVGTTYARFRYSSDIDLGPTGDASDGEVEDYQVTIQPVSSSPDVVLVKRITAINGQTTNPNDSKDLTQVINDGVADSADDEINWPASYLVGELDAGLVQPGDEIEYTVYFMNVGGGAAETVRICDWIQPNQSFVTGQYGGNDIELVIGGTTYNLTDDSDAATDRGEVTTVGSLPATPDCNLSGFTTTATDEVVVVDITGTTGDPTGLATFPHTTGQGTPTNAYGYFRFTTKVDE